MQLSVFQFTLIPVALAILAAALAARVRPGPETVSAIQHFAAGVVFAAAAGEILPDIMHANFPLATLIGGAAGVTLMLGIKQLETRIRGPLGILSMIGFDLFMDGLILGIGFVAAVETGLLLTAALSLEVVFLALALSVDLQKDGYRAGKAVAMVAALMALLPLGALLATPIAILPPAIVTGFFSFGLMALLYLVTEELLAEAHEAPEKRWITAMFFAGFLALLLLEEMMG